MPRKNNTKKPSRLPYDTAPHTKRRYATKQLAERAAEIGELQDFNLELSVYKCPECNGWHLTSNADDSH